MTPKLKSYSDYQDSGVPWLGDIPAHWQQLPGRACFVEKKTPNAGMQETTVLSLSYGQIVVKPPEKLHGLVPASFETYQIIEPYDIVIRPTDLQNDWVSLRTGLARTRGIITSAYMRLRTRDPLAEDYGHLLLDAYDLKKVFYGLGSGLRQNLSWRDFKYLSCLVPPPEEQAAIARFLSYIDRRTRRYIRAQRKLIALLEEQKQAIIQRAVTRGLDPNIRVKPSGVDWLGEVPEHWEIKRAKYYLREVNERSATGEEELLSVSHITGVTPRSQKNITMFMASSYVGHKLCQPGDLAVNTMWVWMGALGIAKQIGIVSPSYSVYRPLSSHAFVPNFLDSLLRTKPYVSEYVLRSTGIRSSRLRVYPEEFLKIRLVRPPYEEQERIVEAITQKTHHIDRAISQTQREINLIREYRTRLIADVVTGKLDVRQAAANLPDEAEELEELDALEESEEESDEGLDEAEFGGDDDE